MATWHTYRHIDYHDLNTNEAFDKLFLNYCLKHDIFTAMDFYVWYDGDGRYTYSDNLCMSILREYLLKAGASFGETVYIDLWESNMTHILSD